MGDIHDDLREVMGLLGKATPGPWVATHPLHRVGGIPGIKSDAHKVDIAAFQYQMDSDSAAAAVNFLRQHGPALLARQEGEDAERLDWLDKHAVSVAYERKLSPSSTHSAVAIIRHPMAEGHGTVRAFVDAARSGGGG